MLDADFPSSDEISSNFAIREWLRFALMAPISTRLRL
jgi:hypothetical protein